MKRFISILLAVIVIVLAIVAVYFISKPAYTGEGLYNYFENKNVKVLVDLKDYIAINKINTIEIYDKKNGSNYVLADSVFDIEKRPLFLIHSQNNTLYYICTDNTTGTMICNAFDLDTYEKRKVYSYKAVTNPNGFLGIDSILGITLVGNNSFSMIINSGNFWLNNEGMHTISERRELLKKHDNNEQYGIFDEVDKIAETDDYIFFINFYKELIRFDKKNSSFNVIKGEPIKDFFITNDKLYYITHEAEPALFCCEHNGNNAVQIAKICPEYVKYLNGTLYIADGEYIYKITDKGIMKISAEPNSPWIIDEKNIYIYNNTIEMNTIEYSN